ncbi:glycoside hydrolase family 18 protein [Sclerotinia borealis F-4128]|uniref:chitinase n=1 Tax=Sclerotinia borealis (strain F-4128) TaxID=1432307 RepID=W9C8J3_SCLBF|nr:glycoside hydrolase family 18 protein [Sclerotinia borealis F-4128]
MVAKKRKASRQMPKSDKQDFDKSKGKVAFNSYEDIADSEDEFHINRDKVLLDQEPHAKRQRKSRDEDELIEQSDEEILGYSEESSEEEEEVEAPKSKKKSKAKLSDDEGAEEEENEDAEGWGSSKRDYYDADNIETEADALEEEAEAKRLQQKKLQKMSEADFGFDENEWLGEGGDEEEGDVVTEVLKDVEITEDMGPEERLRILQTRYPEFEFLANEFVGLQPILQDLQKEVDEMSEDAIEAMPIPVVKARALAAYLAALTMYFAILTSPAKDGKGQGKTIDPLELRDHAVMDSLLQCRELWLKVKSIEVAEVEDSSEDESMDNLEDAIMAEEEMETIRPTKKSRKELARATASEMAAAKRSRQIQEAEDDLADLDNLVSRSKKSKKASRAVVEADDDSDFGEEESMDAKAAEEKAKRKKSLKFYTSQIAQKSNRRADAGRGAGGDEDLPYRERLRDRQARLNVEAEKRGKKLDEYGRGTALGGDSDDDDQAVAGEVRDNGDEYYDMVAQTSKNRKDDKDAKYAAIVEAKKAGKLARVVEVENDEDGKRAIGYVIEKNKGLAPKRKKEVRNPRVKKRMKYEEKKKKLGSMRAVYKGGEEKGGYGGEKTGIKTGLVKSRKLLGQCDFESANCTKGPASHHFSNRRDVAQCGRSAPQGSQVCPLNTCCSGNGYCGTTSAYCINADPINNNAPCQRGYGACGLINFPNCAGSSTASHGRKVAYWQTGSATRICNALPISLVQTQDLSHLIFAFMSISPSTYKVIPFDNSVVSLMYPFTALASTTLATYMGVGGGGSTGLAGTWSLMVGSQGTRATFIRSVQDWLLTFGFQGVDLDWEFPGSVQDRDGFVLLVREMREIFDANYGGRNWGISVVLPPDISTLQYFDPINLEPVTNFFNFMSYDLHGPWEASNPSLGAYIRPQTSLLDIASALAPLWFAGVDPQKVNLGLAAYGRGYVLSESVGGSGGEGCDGVGCPYVGPSLSGPCTRESGVLSLREIEVLVGRENLGVSWVGGGGEGTATGEQEVAVKQFVFGGGKQWMGFDDEESWGLKRGFADRLCMGGTVVWSLDLQGVGR